MWREGLNADLIAWAINIAALVFGAGLGVRALLDPKWAAGFVRLQADGQGGGFAEFRATYGGVFLGLHLIASILSAGWVADGVFAGGLMALGASTALASGWAGACAGRALSMWRDGTGTKFNILSCAVEAAMAAAIAAPMLSWGFGLSRFS